jgi:hypothetical protein
MVSGKDGRRLTLDQTRKARRDIEAFQLDEDQDRSFDS